MKHFQTKALHLKGLRFQFHFGAECIRHRRPLFSLSPQAHSLDQLLAECFHTFVTSLLTLQFECGQFFSLLLAETAFLLFLSQTGFLCAYTGRVITGSLLGRGGVDMALIFDG